jgi:hypothetical protein
MCHRTVRMSDDAVRGRFTLYRATHRLAPRSRAWRRAAVVLALAPVTALAPAGVGSAQVGPNVLTAVVTTPDGTRAPGAVATLSRPIAGQADLRIGQVRTKTKDSGIAWNLFTGQATRSS